MRPYRVLGVVGSVLLACGGATNDGGAGGGGAGGGAGATGGSAGVGGDSGIVCWDDGGAFARAARSCTLDSECQIGIARACCGADHAYGVAKTQAAPYGACFAITCAPGLGCAKFLGYVTDTGLSTSATTDAIDEVVVRCTGGACTTDVASSDAGAPSTCFDSTGHLVSAAKACATDGDCDMLPTETCCGPSTIVGIAKSAAAYAACYPVPQNCPPLGCASQATTEDGRPAPSGIGSALVRCVAVAGGGNACMTSHNPDAG